MFFFDFGEEKPVALSIEVNQQPLRVYVEDVPLAQVAVSYKAFFNAERAMKLEGSPVIYYSRAPKVPSLEATGDGELRDLVQGKYFGGLKVWSCTSDVCSFVSKHLATVDSKRVLEIGCGQGLCGIMALMCGAQHVTFHDYNKEVLELCTKPNVAYNCCEKDLASTAAFCHGDWDEFSVTEEQKYDVILGADVLYDVEACQKVSSLIPRVLQTSGLVVLGTKEFYFGTNGGCREFEAALAQSSPGMTMTTHPMTCETGMKRLIIVLERC